MRAASRSTHPVAFGQSVACRNRIADHEQHRGTGVGARDRGGKIEVTTAPTSTLAIERWEGRRSGMRIGGLETNGDCRGLGGHGKIGTGVQTEPSGAVCA